jgi:hypothetical protein
MNCTCNDMRAYGGSECKAPGITNVGYCVCVHVTMRAYGGSERKAPDIINVGDCISVCTRDDVGVWGE